MKKALIAMSGGVDSSVAAVFMKEKGYDPIGVTMKLYDNEDINMSKENIAVPAPTGEWEYRSVFLPSYPRPESIRMFRLGVNYRYDCIFSSNP